MKNHLENEVNFSHLASVGIVSVFSGIRRTIGFIGLFGLVIAGALGLLATAANGPATVNTSPVCDRVAFTGLMEGMPPPGWGNYVQTQGTAHPNFYVREAKGNGWCLAKKSSTYELVNGVEYKYRWTEIPSKYGEKMEQLAPHTSRLPIVAMALGFFSFAILFAIWIPATIIAAVGRRLMENVREEPF